MKKATKARERGKVKAVKAWAHIDERGDGQIDPNYIRSFPGYFRWGKDIPVLVTPILRTAAGGKRR